MSSYSRLNFLFRKKSNRYVYNIIILGVLCVLGYQVYFLKVMSDDVTMTYTTSSARTITIPRFIRGVRQREKDKYKPNSNGMFVCLDTNEEIKYNHINDDYCDCPKDGSDEPGTNACANGKFFCETGEPKVPLTSGKVNDGVCDCCDGSDEWMHLFPAKRLSENLQRKLGRYMSPCPNLCPEDV